MSNNKQSSVEWLAENIPDLSKYIPFGVSMELHAKFQQAKAMHKEEIENAYLTCYEEYTAEGKHWEMGMNPKETFDEYYKENYESN